MITFRGERIKGFGYVSPTDGTRIGGDFDHTAPHQFIDPSLNTIVPALSHSSSLKGSRRVASCRVSKRGPAWGAPRCERAAASYSKGCPPPLPCLPIHHRTVHRGNSLRPAAREIRGVPFRKTRMPPPLRPRSYGHACTPCFAALSRLFRSS